MDRIPVESRQIKSIGHDDTACLLEVEFLGGSVYRYAGVGVATFDELMKSESKGKYFGQNIKSHPEIFPFEKIRGSDREEIKKLQNSSIDGVSIENVSKEAMG